MINTGVVKVTMAQINKKNANRSGPPCRLLFAGYSNTGTKMIAAKIKSDQKIWISFIKCVSRVIRLGFNGNKGI